MADGQTLSSLGNPPLSQVDADQTAAFSAASGGRVRRDPWASHDEELSDEAFIQSEAYAPLCLQLQLAHVLHRWVVVGRREEPGI